MKEYIVAFVRSRTRGCKPRFAFVFLEPVEQADVEDFMICAGHSREYWLDMRTPEQIDNIWSELTHWGIYTVVQVKRNKYGRRHYLFPTSKDLERSNNASRS